MEFDDFLKGVDIINLKAKDRWQAIDELIDGLVAAGKIAVEDGDAIVHAVRTRERAMSTGIGYGIAIPHASTDLISEVVGVLGRSKVGVQFEALDGKAVHVVLLFLVPAGEFQKHMHTLAHIAKFIHRKDFRDRLRGGDENGDGG